MYRLENAQTRVRCPYKIPLFHSHVHIWMHRQARAARQCATIAYLSDLNLAMGSPVSTTSRQGVWACSKAIRKRIIFDTEPLRIFWTCSFFLGCLASPSLYPNSYYDEVPDRFRLFQNCDCPGLYHERWNFDRTIVSWHWIAYDSVGHGGMPLSARRSGDTCVWRLASPFLSSVLRASCMPSNVEKSTSNNSGMK